ncbi:MAG: PAS-domain containing protein, partial [Pseudomonadota bacterium]|nr:PAS-domain containing protein [Pseudomonadota bacterium]
IRARRQDWLAPLDLVWIEDISAMERYRFARAEAFDVTRSFMNELEALLDHLDSPAWIRHEDLSLAWINMAYAEAFEETREDVLMAGREIAATVNDRSGLGLARRARGAGQRVTERRHIVLHGQRRLVEFSETPVSDLGVMVGFALDRTAEEDIQTRLSRHIDAHDEVLEHLGSAIAIYGPDQRLKFFNGAWLHLWGIEERWARTEPSLAEVLEYQRERRLLPEQADFKIYKKKRLEQFTDLLEPQEALWHLPSGQALRHVSAPHPMGGLLMTYEDVTSRLQLETSYNTLMAVQNETLDNLKEGIAVIGGDGRLRLWNPAFLRIWNMNPEQVSQDMHITDMLNACQHFFAHLGDIDRLRATAINNTLDRTEHRARIERIDGTIIDYMVVPLPDGASLNSFLDVTDSVRVEQVLREKTVALEAAEKLKTDFLANVSYQLRTPLNTILGFSEILSGAYFGKLNTRQEDYIKGIVDSGKRLTGLVDDLLDLATIEAGYMSLNPAFVDVHTLLTGMRDLTIEWARKQQLEIGIECDHDIGRIACDSVRIKQVLGNLISNAIHFSLPDGRIVLSARRDGDEMILEVADTGVGMSEADKARAFSAFERSDGQDHSGIGLGLALVRRFIELHGGRVELESRLGHGTSVRCILPNKVSDER